jgi:organic hydroperoxide reductase OsmC/OhrA
VTIHTYAITLTWSGSTGAGYRRYSRSHQVVPRGAAGIAMSSDPAFRGDPSLANPEQLLLAAASSCQLLSFLAVAARAGVDVVDYTDDAAAVMPEQGRPVRIDRITLRPVIAVRGVDAVTVQQLVKTAHEDCYVANSLAVPVDVEPVIRVAS